MKARLVFSVAFVVLALLFVFFVGTVRAAEVPDRVTQSHANPGCDPANQPPVTVNDGADLTQVLMVGFLLILTGCTISAYVLLRKGQS